MLIKKLKKKKGDDIRLTWNLANPKQVFNSYITSDLIKLTNFLISGIPYQTQDILVTYTKTYKVFNNLLKVLRYTRFNENSILNSLLKNPKGNVSVKQNLYGILNGFLLEVLSSVESPYTPSLKAYLPNVCIEKDKDSLIKPSIKSLRDFEKKIQENFKLIQKDFISKIDIKTAYRYYLKSVVLKSDNSDEIIKEYKYWEFEMSLLRSLNQCLSTNLKGIDVDISIIDLITYSVIYSMTQTNLPFMLFYEYDKFYLINKYFISFPEATDEDPELLNRNFLDVWFYKANKIFFSNIKNIRKIEDSFDSELNKLNKYQEKIFQDYLTSYILNLRIQDNSFGEKNLIYSKTNVELISELNLENLLNNIDQEFLFNPKIRKAFLYLEENFQVVIKTLATLFDDDELTFDFLKELLLNLKLIWLDNKNRYLDTKVNLEINLQSRSKQFSRQVYKQWMLVNKHKTNALATYSELEDLWVISLLISYVLEYLLENKYSNFFYTVETHIQDKLDEEIQIKFQSNLYSLSFNGENNLLKIPRGQIIFQIQKLQTLINLFDVLDLSEEDKRHIKLNVIGLSKMLELKEPLLIDLDKEIVID